MKAHMKSRIKAPPESKASGRSIFDDNSFRVERAPSMATKYTIYLYGPIEDSTQFIDAIEALDAAGENDLVIIKLSTPGGSVDATDTFIHHMKNCQAEVIIEASGGCHSAGSMILLAADKFTLSDNFCCLVHNGSTGYWGKSSDVAAMAKFEIPWMEKIDRATYAGFLNPEELDAMIAGKDFWMDADEFLRRVKQRAELNGETLDNSES